MRRIVDLAESEAADVVAPQSGGKRDVEPLCAFYSKRCLPAIMDAIGRDDLRTVGFYDDVRVVPVPIDEVRAFGDPAVLFMNVNTLEELQHAERLAAEHRL